MAFVLPLLAACSASEPSSAIAPIGSATGTDATATSRASGGTAPRGLADAWVVEAADAQDVRIDPGGGLAWSVDVTSSIGQPLTPAVVTATTAVFTSKKVVAAVDLTTGKPLWKAAASPPPTAVIDASAEQVLVMFPTHLDLVGARTGQLVWQHFLRGSYGSAATSSAPHVLDAGDLLVVSGVGGSVALARSTGMEVWHSPAGSPFVDRGGTVTGLHNALGMVAVDPRTGVVLAPLGLKPAPSTHLEAVSGQVLLRDESGLSSFDATTAQERWRVDLPRGASIVSISDEVIGWGSQTGTMGALSAMDGSRLWERPSSIYPRQAPVDQAFVGFEQKDGVTLVDPRSGAATPIAPAGQKVLLLATSNEWAVATIGAARPAPGRGSERIVAMRVPGA